MTATRTASLGLLLLAFLPFLAGDAAAQDAAAQRVAAILDEASRAPADRLWDRSEDLRDLGAQAAPALTEGLRSRSPAARLVAARALLDLGATGSRDAALAALRDLVAADIDRPLRVDACDMLYVHAQRRSEVEPLFAVFRQVRDPYVRIALARLLREKARYADAVDILRDYLESTDYEVRAAAAIALAEVGNVEAAREVLQVLRYEPTPRGRYALALLTEEELVSSLEEASAGVTTDEGRRAYLQRSIDDLERRLAEARRQEAAAGLSFGNPLLDELGADIRRFYDYQDETEVSAERLVDAAAHGMVSSLDPFSSYMNPQETEAFENVMGGRYGGIGAVVSIDPTDRILTIIRPIYSGPAYEAGLRSMDKITAIEGQPTTGRPIEELVALLKGEPGTPVHFTVWRRGWPTARDFTLIRREIQLDSVQTTMLPGRLGYLSLSQFGEHAVEEVESGLRTLESQGMRALVFDLRSNPGGLLTAAVDIADKFLSGQLLIVYSQGRNQYIAPRREFRTREQSTHPAFPMFVLVNGASASASEIVAGALQDHHRATIIGTTTFGKGSVQQLMPVEALGRAARLRLTIARYYLPSGRSIHEVGVTPDVVVEEPTIPTWIDDAVNEVANTGAFERYMDEHFESDVDLFRQLAWWDGADSSRYPGFDAWSQSLSTRASPEYLLRALRARVRRSVQDLQGAQFACDVEDDVQLRRAVFEALRALGEEPSNFPEYATLASEFAAAPEGQ